MEPRSSRVGAAAKPPLIRHVSQRDPEYSRLLMEIPDPPEVLFVAGLPLEPAPHVAIVGSRKPTRYGLEVAETLARELANAGLVIVSGMARGIDAAAHKGALAAGGATVAVLGCSIEICYPPANRALYRQIAERGTLVSEFPTGTIPFPSNFPKRNRVIAGLSLGVVVIEGREDGGAMITARLAGEAGREVFAVPGPVHSDVSRGPHALIREGARLVTSAADVLQELGFDSPALSYPHQPSLLPDEVAVMTTLGAEPILLDLIASRSRLPASSAAAVLARLELKELVTRYPGGRFAICVNV